MAVAIALVLALLAFQHVMKRDVPTDVDTAERMQQREQDLNQQMAQLLEEMEWRRAAEEATLLSVLKQWPFSTVAGALVLLAGLCWVVRRKKLAFRSYFQQDNSSSKKEDDKENEGLNGARSGVKFWPESNPSLLQVQPDTCTVLKELVGDLLGVCRALCKKTFMPQMHPATGMDSCLIQENSVAYRLLVFLQPPPGHSFSLELDTTGQLPARHSGVRVLLECMCSRQLLLGDVFCFLHHPDDKLPRDQSSYLLRTLCTGTYLDVEKIASWVQHLVRSAWPLLPQSQHCQLTVLPSSQSCRFRLQSTSKVNICAEMIFAVQ